MIFFTLLSPVVGCQVISNVSRICFSYLFLASVSRIRFSHPFLASVSRIRSMAATQSNMNSAFFNQYLGEQLPCHGIVRNDLMEDDPPRIDSGDYKSVMENDLPGINLHNYNGFSEDYNGFSEDYKSIMENDLPGTNLHNYNGIFTEAVRPGMPVHRPYRDSLCHIRNLIASTPLWQTIIRHRFKRVKIFDGANFLHRVHRVGKRHSAMCPCGLCTFESCVERLSRDNPTSLVLFVIKESNFRNITDKWNKRLMNMSQYYNVVICSVTMPNSMVLDLDSDEMSQAERRHDNAVIRSLKKNKACNRDHDDALVMLLERILIQYLSTTSVPVSVTTQDLYRDKHYLNYTFQMIHQRDIWMEIDVDGSAANSEYLCQCNAPQCSFGWTGF